MAYSVTNSKGNTYYLNSKVVTLRGGRQQTIYYFSKEVNASTSLDEIPEGYEVYESKNGLPVLRRQ